MASIIKFILLFLLVLFLVTVVRIALSIFKLLSMPLNSQKKNNEEPYQETRRSADGRTIELGKKDYKVE
jgi:hypothetical protein